MSKFVFALVASLILNPGITSAEDLDDVVVSDDICKSRPELCEEVELDDDGNPIAPAPKKPVAKKTGPSKSLKAEAPKRRCRVRGQNYSLEEADLPYCAMTAAQQKAAAIAAREKANATKKTRRITDEERFDALYNKGPRTPVKTASPAARVPASAAGPGAGPAVTFESYLKSNQVHPALAMKIQNRQTAFIEVQRPAVIGIQLKEGPDAPAPEVLGTPVPSMEKPGPVAPPPQGY